MVGRLHPFSRPKENPSDLSHRLLAEIDGALRELDAITAPNDDVADRIGCAENAMRRAREAAAALSGREAVAWQVRLVATHGGAGYDWRETTRDDYERHAPGSEGTGARVEYRELFTTPQPGDGWRPIAEAPKDGVVWLGCEGNMRLAFWHRTEERWIDHAAAEANEPVRGLRFTPTVWHDVPAAPSAKGIAP